MIYLFFLLFSCCYLFRLHRYRNLSYRKLYIYFIPIILLWCLLIGGQYNVGTDYFAYLEIFNGQIYYIAKHRGEFVFAAFVRLCNAFGISGQGIFFILSFIWITILIKILADVVESRYSYILFFVFVVFPGIFHNQMNGVRQYFAVYLFTLAVCCYLRKEYKKTALLLFPMFFIHSSSMLITTVMIVGFLCLDKIIKHPKWLYGLVVISVILSRFLSISTISGFLNHFGNVKMIEAYSASYLSSGRITQTGLVIAITKYIYLPLILYSIHLFDKMSLNDYEKKMFVIGICGYCFKLSLVSIAIIHRMGQYFDILMCLPLTYMLISLLEKKKKRSYYTIITYLLCPYALKVTALAVGEYQYHSIFFH